MFEYIGRWWLLCLCERQNQEATKEAIIEKTFFLKNEKAILDIFVCREKHLSVKIHESNYL